jgi:hypothetical protein
MKTKQELEQSIVMLEEQVATNKTMSAAYQQDLDLATKALADINKPVLTGLQLDNVQEAIEDAVGHFDFDDADNYNKEFELDYDGRVQLSHLEFESAQELIESIVEKVHKLFAEAEVSEL